MKHEDGGGVPSPRQAAARDTGEETLVLPPITDEAADASDEFAGRVRRAIHRRLFAANVVEFCVVGPAIAVMEFVVTVVAVFHRRDSQTGTGEQGGDR